MTERHDFEIFKLPLTGENFYFHNRIHPPGGKFHRNYTERRSFVQEYGEAGFEVYSSNETQLVPTGKKYWKAQCDCNASFLLGIVLDPFGGSGTSGKKANEEGRDFTMIELNPLYLQIIHDKTDVLAKHKRLDQFT